MKISGIYKIINRVNGKYYVGSSDDIERRFERHKLELNKNRHHSIKLQRAWTKYGKENFNYNIIENISKHELLQREQYYLDICKENPNTNYNICYNAFSPMLGRKHSLDTLLKMSKSQSGKNNPMFGKIGANIGKCFSEETKQKMSTNNCRYWKGKRLSDEHRQKLKFSHPTGKDNPTYGRHHTNEAKNKLSLAKRDNTIFTFKNKNTNEVFIGISYDFSIKNNLLPNSVRCLVNKKLKSLKGWILLS